MAAQGKCCTKKFNLKNLKKKKKTLKESVGKEQGNFNGVFF